MFLGQPKGVSAILTILSLLPIPRRGGGSEFRTCTKMLQMPLPCWPFPRHAEVAVRLCCTKPRASSSPFAQILHPTSTFSAAGDVFFSKWEKNTNIVNWRLLGMSWLAKIFTPGFWAKPSHMITSCILKLSQKKTIPKVGAVVCFRGGYVSGMRDGWERELPFAGKKKKKKAPELDTGNQIRQLKSLYFLKVAILGEYITAFIYKRCCLRMPLHQLWTAASFIPGRGGLWAAG